MKFKLNNIKKSLPFALLFLGYFIGDIATTAYGLSANLASECNPLDAWFMTHFGIVPGLVIIKGIPAFLIIGAACYLYKKSIILWKPENFMVILGIEGCLLTVLNLITIFH